MYTGHPGHCDAFNVFLLDAEVRAAEGDGDASLHGAEMRDDLDGEIQCAGVGVGVYRKKGFEKDWNRLVVQ